MSELLWGAMAIWAIATTSAAPSLESMLRRPRSTLSPPPQAAAVFPELGPRSTASPKTSSRSLKSSSRSLKSRTSLLLLLLLPPQLPLKINSSSSKRSRDKHKRRIPSRLPTPDRSRSSRFLRMALLLVVLVMPPMPLPRSPSRSCLPRRKRPPLPLLKALPPPPPLAQAAIQTPIPIRCAPSPRSIYPPATVIQQDTNATTIPTAKKVAAPSSVFVPSVLLPMLLPDLVVVVVAVTVV
mmetsp:Transcript_21264/g.45911  ORF Transcript_21264/g.45911 Transcript_21264/m.45911 type:complete len:239 (+) Transcript_21264:728-1444(+)